MGTKTHPLDHAEFGRYLDALRNAPKPRALHAAALAVCIGSGARVGEVLALRMCDLFERDGTPKSRISRNVEKQRKAARVTAFFPWRALGNPIVAWRAEAIKRFAARYFEPIFSARMDRKPISRRILWSRNRDFLRAAGIDPRGVGLHGIRKTYLRSVYKKIIDGGTDSFEAVAIVQNLAGHRRVDTTVKYLFDDSTKKTADAVEQVFGKWN